MDPSTLHKLTHAATNYDRRLEASEIRARRMVNIHRLPLILGCIFERIVPDYERHGDLRRAVCENTNDRLRDALLKGLGQPRWDAATDHGRH